MSSPLEAVVASGDGQHGTVGQPLQQPLQVVVRTISAHKPKVGVAVLWSVEEGDASFVGLPSTVTDSTGSATVRVRLGTETGEITVRATVQDNDAASATFSLYSVGRPVLHRVDPLSAAPGESITLTGSNFSPYSEQDVVLFSGVRGRVTEASPTQLTVQVPMCLPEGHVVVSVQLGTVASESSALSVQAGGDVREMQVGEILDATDSAGFSCFTLPRSGSESYLATVYSASTVGGATHPFQLTGLGVAASVSIPLSRLSQRRSRVQLRVASDPQIEWDERIRALESELTRGRRTLAPGPGSRLTSVEAPFTAPSLGDRRTFQVFTSGGEFEEVTAVAEYLGEEAVFFVDENGPPGGYTRADLQMFSDRFDEVTHPTVTSNFGAASDLDRNDRIVILLTPLVNSLTPRGTTGFIGGFFFGLDLLPERDNSNNAEIFYALVPDAEGTLSDPRPKAGLLEVIPAILAHEFQHMVHFNERVLMLGAEGGDALWLSEGLAQYAEELVAQEHLARGNVEVAELFRSGIRNRAREYLKMTDSVAVIVSNGRGSLAERGAGFLNLMYVADRFGLELVGRLTRTTRTGVANLEAETGLLWADLLSDWWLAMYLDGMSAGTGPISFPGVDFRGFLGDPFPLNPFDPGPDGFRDDGLLRSSSAKYYILNPLLGGSVTLRLGGDAGGVSAPQAAMRMRIIRIK